MSCSPMNRCNQQTLDSRNAHLADNIHYCRLQNIDKTECAGLVNSYHIEHNLPIKL